MIEINTSVNANTEELSEINKSNSRMLNFLSKFGNKIENNGKNLSKRMSNNRFEMARKGFEEINDSTDNLSNVKFQEKLIKLFHSYRFHLIIISLVIVDCIIVVAQLLIEVHLLQSKEKHSPLAKIVHVLHYVSIAILCLFGIEVLFKLYAFRLAFFKSKLEMFDAFIIYVSLGLDFYFLFLDDPSSTGAELIIVLRLWRVVRVAHGMALSAIAPIEHQLDKEKKRGGKLVEEIEEMKDLMQKLRNEILELRGRLQDYTDISDLPTLASSKLF